MATDQDIEDLTNLVNSYVDDVTKYEEAVQAANAAQTQAIATLNASVASLQAQITNGPDNKAAIAALMAKVTAAKADVDTKTAAANAAGDNTAETPDVPTT